MLLRVLLLVLSVTVVACTPKLPSTNSSLNWQAHLQNVQDFQSWNLQGRLSVRSQDEAKSISIFWRQQDKQYVLNLNGPLGLGAVQVSGDEQGVLIEKSGEDPVTASDLGEVSLYYLGYEFPASQLYYWVRGIPDPNSQEPPELTLNDAQQLASLRQGAWEMEYDLYRTEDSGLVLPGRIKVRHEDYRLTFRVREWN